MIEKVVYVLGAGFSRDLGLPLMSDFVVRVVNVVPGPKRTSRQRTNRPIEDRAERPDYDA